MSLIDGVFTTIITEGGQFSSMMMAEYMGITPRYTDSTSIGGSSFVVYVEHAAMAIAAGLCEVATGNNRCATLAPQTTNGRRPPRRSRAIWGSARRGRSSDPCETES